MSAKGKSSPSLDMTPMVDLAFLLVTFFMLTTKFTPEDPVLVDMPSSVAEIKIPETDILMITVSGSGDIFFNLEGKYQKQALLKKIGEKYGIDFTEAELDGFSKLSGVGVPIGNLQEYLALDDQVQKQTKQPGVPCDSSRNELSDWIMYSRITNPKVRIAIKADRQTSYPVIRQVIKTLQDQNISRFNLVTDLEQSTS
ncbi:MAG: biopolymer transporter ExbD [Imperialibacter sp.]|uniref:ExbD/TolR family protein n=1 Tax=Imperialibacter sp. TaxID=2038411 RepID=UPI0032EBB31F